MMVYYSVGFSELPLDLFRRRSKSFANKEKNCNAGFVKPTLNNIF